MSDFNCCKPPGGSSVVPACGLAFLYRDFLCHPRILPSIQCGSQWGAQSVRRVERTLDKWEDYWSRQARQTMKDSWMSPFKTGMGIFWGQTKIAVQYRLAISGKGTRAASVRWCHGKILQQQTIARAPTSIHTSNIFGHVLSNSSRQALAKVNKLQEFFLHFFQRSQLHRFDT